MIYLVLKAMHVAAVLAFAGGLLLLAVVSASWGWGGALLPHEQRAANAVLRWDRYVTVPAMMAVWALGLALAVMGGWMGAHWLQAKIALVVVLSGMHGMLSGSLRRRRAEGRGPLPSWVRASPSATLVALGVIAILVVVKP